MASSPASRWRRAVDSRYAPLALIAISAVLIVLTIRRFSIWIDESATLELVVPNGYLDIASLTALDVHPPLWYWVLKPWLQIFGSSIVALRSEQAVFMLAAFGVWYHFVRTRFSRPTALLTLALMVTNPMLLHYAVEGRMYAFAILLVSVSCLLLTGQWRWRWVAYWGCAVAMLYVHFFLVFVVAAQFLYLLLRRRDQGLSLVRLVLYGASILAAFAPWIPHAFHNTSGIVAHGFWIPPILPSSVVDFVLHAFLHRVDIDLVDWKLFVGVVYLIVWGAAVIAAGRERSGPRTLLWCLVAIPPLCLFVLSCKPFVPIFHPRYVVFGLPALITLLSAGALSMTSRWRGFVIAVLVAGHLAGIHMLRWRGFNNTRGYWAMKTIAKEISKPVDGELPDIVAIWLFPFFDAHATLGDQQRVVQLRSAPPSADSFPDVMYRDRADMYILSWREINARHVWVLDNMLEPATEVPPSWELVVTHLRGYARTRLFNVKP